MPGALRDSARGPAFWILGPVEVASAALCAAVPLAARPGYESALVTAPVAAACTGFIAVATVVRLRRLGAPFPFGAVLGRTALAAAPWLAALLAVLFAAGAIRGFCDPWQGIGFLAIGPIGSAVAAWAIATAIALAVPGRRLPHLAWAAVLAMSFGWDLFLVYATPQVFVFDHLLGVFAGPIYDEAIGLERQHAYFRLITLARVAPALALAYALHDPARLRLAPGLLGRRAAAGSLAALVAALVATFLAEPALGLRTSERAIRAALGATTATRHFTIHHASELGPRQVAFLEAEAELYHRELREFFGGAPASRLTIYLFRTATEMRRLTGTGPTNVAKPWLGSTCLVYAPPPHPVLKHELAHLFSAAWGRGPFRTPGAAWGILADPLILEGTAVAADWDGDPLDPHMQSAAIIQAGLIEDPAALVGLSGFYTHEGGLSYVLGGSFVRHLREKHGAAAIRSWYAGAPFDRAFGTTLDAALDEWEARLRATEVPRPWISAMARRHSGKSVFHRPCPHQVALLVREAALARILGRPDRTAAIMDRVCAIAPEDPSLAIARVSLLVSTGRADPAARALERIEPGEEYLPILTELAGDVAWLRGEDAGPLYEKALAMAVEDGAIRMLSVKIWAAYHPMSGRIRGYLLGSASSPPGDPASGIQILLSVSPRDPVAGYLLGRACANAVRWKEAARYLELATSAGLPHPVLQAEALRLLAETRLWDGDVDGALAALSGLDATGPPTPALAYHASRWRSLAIAVR